MSRTPLRILTYNLWHGLDGRALIKMGELETTQRRSQRLEQQLDDLQQLSADLMFFQEVNPLRARMHEIATKLHVAVEGQSDLSGLKFWHRGPPFNLNSGLVIAAQPHLQLRQIAGLKLSGPVGFSGSNVSFQLQESRYALIGKMTTPSGVRLLVVNVHLHHGFEAEPALLNAVEKLVSEDLISWQQHAVIMKHLNAARERRRGELDRLFRYLEKIQMDFDGVIIAGDFNTSPSSATVEYVKSRGWIDVVKSPLWTWDQSRNSYNFDLSRNFALPVPDFGIPQLREVLLNHLYRRTRLDYVFVSANLSSQIGQADLFGVKSDPESITSDHFGLMIEINA